jgi:hypothetical protein
MESAINAGTIAKGPKGLRDSMLVQESFWFDMNYPEQITFMQRFECAAAGVSGKHLLYHGCEIACQRQVELGRLEWLSRPRGPTTRPSQECQKSVDENRVGLTGEARTAFVNSAVDACNKSSASPTYCSCYANAMADSLSAAELKQMAAPGNQEAGMTALRPKLEAAARRCL